MPYAIQLTGVYRIVNRAERTAYVGSSRNLLKRRAEHFRLLRKGIHPNQNLQHAFNVHGENTFDWVEEISCTEENDARELELQLLKGELTFDEDTSSYNIAFDAFPMMGRTHSDYTKQRISDTKKACAKPLTQEAQQKLIIGQTKRRLSDPDHKQKVRYIVENDHLSYAERARAVGISTSSARKLFLRYAKDYGKVPPPPRVSYDRGVAEKLEYIRANPDKTLKMLARELGCSANSVGVLVRRYNLR